MQFPFIKYIFLDPYFFLLLIPTWDLLVMVHLAACNKAPQDESDILKESRDI